MSFEKTCLLIYGCSALISWIYWKINYSKYGDDHGFRPNYTGEYVELKTIFIPIINTFFAIASWFISSPFKPSGKYHERNLTERILFTKKKKID